MRCRPSRSVCSCPGLSQILSEGRSNNHLSYCPFPSPPTEFGGKSGGNGNPTSGAGGGLKIVGTPDTNRALLQFRGKIHKKSARLLRNPQRLMADRHPESRGELLLDLSQLRTHDQESIRSLPVPVSP